MQENDVASANSTLIRQAAILSTAESFILVALLALLVVMGRWHR